MKELDTYEKTRTIFPPFSLVIRAASLLKRKLEHVQIKKIGRIPKPPFLLISTHASFMDFFVSIKANEPYQPYWVSTIEEYIDKDFVFRELGIIPKRKFTNDPRSAKLMMEVLKDRKKILIIYPEARYSFVGKPERLDKGLAKIAKNCDVPIVFMRCNGHYLRDPQWGDHHIRKVRPLVSEMKCIISKKYVEQLSVDEINEIIQENFVYDDEQYQTDHHILIDYPKRAEGIERILYKCPHCGKEFEMTSFGDTFKCKACGAEYRYNEDGSLKRTNGETRFSKVSDWYCWEKDCVREEVEDGTYGFEDDVRVEKLEGTGVGFVPMGGKHHLKHSISNGFEVNGDDVFKYERAALQSYAVHIEYDYKHRGGCIDLATNTETYFVYPLNKPQALTKIHFANECIYDLAKSKIK